MKEYRTISKIAGTLVFVEKTEPIAYGELVNIILSDGSTKRGQVLDTSDELVVVQIFETTAGIGRDSGVRFTGETIKMPVGKDVLPSLSRLMNLGIGKGHTREDHKKVSDQMYAGYAEGNDLRGLVAIVGKDALSERDRLLLEFADLFENRFVRQGYDEDRTIEDTLNLGWQLLSTLPVEQLTRIDRDTINKYHPKFRTGAKKE